MEQLSYTSGLRDDLSEKYGDSIITQGKAKDCQREVTQISTNMNANNAAITVSLVAHLSNRYYLQLNAVQRKCDTDCTICGSDKYAVDTV